MITNHKIYKVEENLSINMHPSDPVGSLDDSFPKNTFVFIDAGFLSKLSRYFGKGKYLVYDIIKFSENISNKQDLECKKIFYYTAPPFQSYNPSSEERTRKDKYDRFVNKLSENSKVVIRQGRCQKINVSKDKIKFAQKGVDTLMTMDLMSVPIKCPEIKKIILIACDSDFVPVINQLREFNLKIILYTYFTKKRNTNFSRSSHLMKSVFKYIKLTKEDFEEAKIKEESLNSIIIIL